MLKTFDEFKSKLCTGRPRTMVVAAAHDSHTLEAVFNAQECMPLEYILVGDKEKIISIANELGKEIDFERIVDSKDDAQSAKIAVSIVKKEKTDALMKGIVPTGTLLKAVLDKQEGIRTGSVMSHVALMEIPAYKKLLAISDDGMIPHPTLDQKVSIIQNLVEFYAKMGGINPKIAALCAVETQSERMPETIEAARLEQLSKEGVLGKCQVEGPVSFDIAMSKESAQIKGYKGVISGECDALIVPNITAGNVLCKSLIYFSGAKMAGCILGSSVPIVLASRAASTQEKLLSIMLCLCAN